MKKHLILCSAVAVGTLFLAGCCCESTNKCRPQKCHRHKTTQCCPSTCPTASETVTIEAVEVVPVDGNNTAPAQTAAPTQTAAPAANQTPAK
jgi:hypothetical protein